MTRAEPASPETAAATAPFARSPRERRFTALVLLGLYGIGLAHWTWFFYRGGWLFEPGHLRLSAHDWPKEALYLHVLQDALREGRIPYHVDVPTELRGRHLVDGRFLGWPETILSPQVLLLALVRPAAFVLAHNLLLYSLGFVGSLALRRRYRLGLIPFATFFVLFNFNGHITAHLGVGHAMWSGYFLLPFFALFVLAGLDEPRSLRPALALALVLFGMLLQGSFHLVVWCWLFLALLTIARPHSWRQGLLALGLSALLGAFRLVPAGITYWGFRTYAFLGGYTDVGELLEAFLRLRFGRAAGLGWWEKDVFVGVLGLVLLVYFGIYQRLAPAADLRPYRFPQLDLPLAVLTVLAFDGSFRPIHDLPIPLLNSERVSSRFLIIPVVMLLAVASIRLGRVLDRGHLDLTGRVIGWACVGEMFAALARHSALWRVPRLEKIKWEQAIPEGRMTIIAVEDPVFTAGIWLSAGFSFLALLAWFYLYVRFRRGRSPGGLAAVYGGAHAETGSRS